MGDIGGQDVTGGIEIAIKKKFAFNGVGRRIREGGEGVELRGHGRRGVSQRRTIMTKTLAQGVGRYKTHTMGDFVDFPSPTITEFSLAKKNNKARVTTGVVPYCI